MAEKKFSQKDDNALEEGSDSDTSSIKTIEHHYLCIKCLKFPYIKFCKDRKHIRITCSCFNNKKILIEEIFGKNNLSKNNNIELALISKVDFSNIDKEFICKKHKKKFKGFSKVSQENYCKLCIKIKMMMILLLTLII